MMSQYSEDSLPLFEVDVADARGWIQQLMATLGLPPEDGPRAVRALRAGLHAIRDRLSAVEVAALAVRMPALIRGIYYDGWSFANDPTRIRNRAQMIARLHRELASEPGLDAVDVLRGVLELLVEHGPPDGREDRFEVLPCPIAALWQDLTGHAAEVLAEDLHLAKPTRRIR
jgi:uncharacterized protein (DUF2267 family)